MIPYIIDSSYNIDSLADRGGEHLADSNGRYLRVKSSVNVASGKIIGYLKDAVNCFAESEANGGYELSFRYPVSGENYNDLQLGNIVMADNCPSAFAGVDSLTDNGGNYLVDSNGRYLLAKSSRNFTDNVAAQPYRIYRITRPINDIVTVYARHIVQTDLSAAVILPSKYDNASSAVDGLTSNAVSPHYFTITSEINTSGEMIITSPTTVLSAMMGNDNSILSIYGGEWLIDSQSATLKERAGVDSKCDIIYGVNLRTFEQDANIADCYTGAVGYYTRGDDPALYTPIVSTASKFSHSRIATIDFTDSFSTPPTVDRLISETKKYISRNGYGIPNVSIKLSYIDLASTTEFVGNPKLVKLWDDVHIIFPTMGIDTTAMVTKTKYNVLLNRYEEIEVGSSKRSLAYNLAKQKYDISKSSTKKEAAAIARYVSNSYVIEQEEQ